jgi:hypothetical protein
MAHLMDEINISKEGKGAFSAALANSNIGDEIIYHIGEYCSGEHKHKAMGASEAGLCILYQRKEAPRRFIYIAKKIKPRKKP